MEVAVSSVYKTYTDIPERECLDVRIPMPWGYLDGKWYGNRQIRPILALHGWLDNLGTWNTLVPLLPVHVGVLCIDLPGHGNSSKLPKGIIYHAVDYVCIILRIMKEYSWQKVSILSHSMSSMISFIFGALYPEKLDLWISIDVIRTRSYRPDHHIEYLRANFDKYIVEDSRLKQQVLMEPPSYTYDQLERVLYEGSQRSVWLENCKHILERNVMRSTKYPDKYYFSRDGRVKYYFEFITSHKFAASLAERLCGVPCCVIKGSESNYINENSHEVIEILRKNNPNFEMHEVCGTHHVHLNNPSGVAAIVNTFINKHRPPTLETWSVGDDAEIIDPIRGKASFLHKWNSKWRKRRSKL